MKKRKLDAFFDTTYVYSDSVMCSTELEGHVIPETVTTPMADLIVDEEYNAEEALKPLTQIQTALRDLPKTTTAFATESPLPIKTAADAIIEPFVDILTPVAAETATTAVEDEEDAEEEIKMDEGTITMAVPGKTAAGVTPTPGPAGDDEGEEVEELNVIQLDGQVVETLKIE